jgi:glycosyltransferase involved in cell wall biosynthesis
MSELKFSVVIPVYNRETKIENAIRSVLAQSYENFEVLVVDDGSTDNTAAVIKNIFDPRVKYFYQENKERAAARNTGIKNSTGDFITFLDSDDEFLGDHLSAISEFIAGHPGSVVCSSFQMVSDKKTILNYMPGNIPARLIRENFLSCNGVFLPAAIAKKILFNEDRILSGLEDWELWLRIASSHKMTGTNKITSQMNYHDERSVLQTSRENIEARFRAFYKYVLNDANILSFYKGKIHLLKAGCETYIALHLALTGKNKKAALGHLFRGIFYSPAIIFKRRFYAIIKSLLR